MKNLKVILALVFVVIVMWMGSIIYAQPNIPKEKIPRDIPTLVRQLIETLYASDPTERTDAVYGLGTLGEQAIPAIPFLIEMFRDNARLKWRPPPSPARRKKLTTPGQEAVTALARIGKPTVGPLIGALKDKDKDKDSVVRATAAQTLGTIAYFHPKEERRVVEPLIEALRDEEECVRYIAAVFLAAIEDTRVLQPLIVALKDGSSGVRLYAAKALGIRKNPLAVEPLIDVLEDENRHVRESAGKALSKITGQNFGQDAEKWQEWWEENKENFLKGR